MSVKLPSHVHRNRHGVFYFRRAVPPDLRGHFARNELYRSLTTASKSEAYGLACYLSARVEVAFALLRQGVPKKNENLTFDMITENSVDELGCPSLRVIREPHDTMEDHATALEQGARALEALRSATTGKASVPPKTGLKLSELVR